MLAAMPFPLVPREEQPRIARAQQPLTSLIRAESGKLGRLAQMKQGLMEDLLTGRVRVPIGDDEH